MASINVHVYAYDKPVSPKVTMHRLEGSSKETVVLKIEAEGTEVQFFLRGKDALEAVTEGLDNAIRGFFLSEANP